MPAKTPDPSREERLAAKLRENLRRRKAQARALAPGESEPGPAPRETQGNGLSKTAPKS